jgi:regulatory protein
VSPPGPSLKARALRYLAMREHSRAELERKLARHLADDGDNHADGSAGETAGARIARVLDDLAAHGLLDEQRAADALVAAQARRFGALKLRHSLRARGVEPEAAAAALEAVAATELERARDVFQRRFGRHAADATDATERARQARFLAGRGFGADVIRRVLRGLDDDSFPG